MTLWIAINFECERYTKNVHKVEEIEYWMPQHYLDVEWPTKISKKTNHRKHRQVSAEKLCSMFPNHYEVLKEMATRYGYTCV